MKQVIYFSVNEKLLVFLDEFLFNCASV